MLHRAFARAEERSLITRNPAALAEKPKPKAHEMNPWTAEEMSRFLAAAEGDRLYGAFVLMATGGLRPGEALGLKWADVDLDRGVLSVRRALVLVGNTPTISEPKRRQGVARSRSRARYPGCFSLGLPTHPCRPSGLPLALLALFLHLGRFGSRNGWPSHAKHLVGGCRRGDLNPHAL
jgi:integrase